MPAEPIILGFVAYSGTGKTTLLERVIPLLRARGLRVALIKHAHHAFDVDRPGKDSYRLRQAGAGQVLLASRRRMALMIEREQEEEPRLQDLLAHFTVPGGGAPPCDIVLVEGFKHEAYPKVELCRPALGHPLLFPKDPDVVAVAADAPLPIPCALPVLDLNRPDTVAAFVVDYLNRAAATPPHKETSDARRL
ncbi:molybdopterin-guanine dinucleotide biosynthesis protein B [Ectothiorhodospiraceae bacterium 2226]|nr:molybdopterin-guanine dinucleotide biosynthesis protein B [Ectothiorhodospiraceae bacterium 2226]